MFDFSTKPIISQDKFDWQIAVYRWLLRNYGTKFRDGTYALVKPDREHFPDKCQSERDVFEKTFQRVKKYAGMEFWPCDLVPQDQDQDPSMGEALLLKNTESGPAGTFRYHYSGKGIVTYNPSLISEPQSIVSTYAHELGHYLTANCKEAPPGGWDYWEPATDMTAVFMGFGIFMANASFIFKQFTSAGNQGWSTQTLGYLSTRELINALAIFIELMAIDSREALPFLKPGLKRDFKKSLKYIKKYSPTEDLVMNNSNHLRVIK